MQIFTGGMSTGCIAIVPVALCMVGMARFDRHHCSIRYPGERFRRHSARGSRQSGGCRCGGSPHRSKGKSFKPRPPSRPKGDRLCENKAMSGANGNAEAGAIAMAMKRSGMAIARMTAKTQRKDKGKPDILSRPEHWGRGMTVRAAPRSRIAATKNLSLWALWYLTFQTRSGLHSILNHKSTR